MAKPIKKARNQKSKKLPSRAQVRETSQILKIDIPGHNKVSARLGGPSDANVCFVFAHGAGAGMDHAFMRSVAEGLAERGIATLRFQFPYMEKGSKRPDAPAIAHQTVRAAVAYARDRFRKAALIAGGKSFGGRMTSQAQAIEPLPGVVGLAFFGFPLHPAGKPSADRAEHFKNVKVPLLFLQGTNDALAEFRLLTSTVRKVGKRAKLISFTGADHSFHVPKKSGRTDAEILNEALNALATWSAGLS